MSRLHLLAALFLLSLAVIFLTGFNPQFVAWPQWAHDPQHTGRIEIAGQPINEKLADIIYDPFTTDEKNENIPIFGEAVLSAHFQATLVDGNSFYMMKKGGTYPLCSPLNQWELGGDCGPNAWRKLDWNVVRYNWRDSAAVAQWEFWSDWKPEPSSTDILIGVGLEGWEVFHPALANGFIYVPGAGGAIWKVDLNTGQAVSHINPFAGGTNNPASTFVASPLTPDANGNIYYNVIELNLSANPWNVNDVAGAWLVKVASDDSSSTVTYATLVPNAPPGTATTCEGDFYTLNYNTLPWPPSENASPATVHCGSQRAPLNLAPAVAPDGTIYTVSVAHLDPQVSYLIAVNPDLTPNWASSMQYRLSDGCGVSLPIAAQGVLNEPNSCRYGTRIGVDPTTNARGSAYVTDLSSATPTVLPDGSVLFGALGDYNYGRGHLFHFGPNGDFINAYSFGWDSTPAVYVHDGTWSIIIKDNHYPGSAYCFDYTNPVCTQIGPGPYYITQLDSNLNVEWSFQNTTIDSQHPNGYEWCVNAPVVDVNGLVYVTSEDGNVYTIPQGHTGVFTQWQQKIFLLQAIGAAYTPLSLGPDGKVYSQNDGHLFVVGK
jgi:hypothetical protein